jgi:hypothetical protein
MTASERLDKFNLDDHGDRHERERWRLIRDRFPNHEIFWRLYVVPLTNRVLGPAADPDRSWIRIRRDIPAQWQKLALCHYSVFYRLSRAAELRLEQAGSGHIFSQRASTTTKKNSSRRLLRKATESLLDQMARRPSSEFRGRR